MTGKGNILWVDDEIELLKPHIMLLEQRGYSVRTATNGSDAIALHTESPADLIFLDEMMPGLGGLETLNEIKSKSPATPIVMVTQYEGLLHRSHLSLYVQCSRAAPAA